MEIQGTTPPNPITHISNRNTTQKSTTVELASAPTKPQEERVPTGIEKTFPNSNDRYVEYERGDFQIMYLLDDHPIGAGPGPLKGDIVIGLGNIKGEEIKLAGIDENTSIDVASTAFTEYLRSNPPEFKNVINGQELIEFGDMIHKHAGRPRHEFSMIDLSKASGNELLKAGEYLMIMDEISFEEFQIMKSLASDNTNIRQTTDFYSYFDRVSRESTGIESKQYQSIGKAIKELRLPTGGFNETA
ncbi:hypothetical protein [Pelagicoccus sp. SDUM812002]|uniref:hypothetical protein n=1 Tax=Pelagicoccus sp. SDUM812002 TaxID=3041266 RepID=UPI0028108B00|nr:hypothetical protein [Pelagicoccus sp. SDUM812002]MDQ8188554.1 hypothetical protein [Pelagicoccus sp. SDUM812002]